MMQDENQRLKVLLSGQKQITDAKNQKHRQFAVSILLNDLESSNEWLQNQTIQLLYFYRDMAIVKEKLDSLYNSDKVSDFIKKQIQLFFAGSLDVSQIIEYRKRQSKMERRLQELRAELDAEEAEEKGYETTTSHLSLVSLKQS